MSKHDGYEDAWGYMIDQTPDDDLPEERIVPGAGVAIAILAVAICVFLGLGLARIW